MDFREIARPLSCAIPRDLLNRADTLIAALAETVDRFPDYECLTLVDRHLGERRLSLAELWRGVMSVHSALSDRGLAHGGRVVIAMPTGPELLSAYFGVLHAGGIPALVPTPTNRTSDRSIYAQHVGAILENAEAHVLCATRDVIELLAEDDTGLPSATRTLETSEIASYRGLPEPDCASQSPGWSGPGKP